MAAWEQAEVVGQKNVWESAPTVNGVTAGSKKQDYSIGLGDVLGQFGAGMVMPVDKSARVTSPPNPADYSSKADYLTDLAGYALKNARQSNVDAGAGLIRGAGSIGATILSPIDKAIDYVKGDRDQNLSGLIKGTPAPKSRNDERREAIDAGLTSALGSDPASFSYGAGKFGGEVAGTAGAGGLIGNALSKVPLAAQYAPGVINALRGAGEAGLGSKIAAGAISGAAQAGVISPDQASTGAVIGGSLPVVGKVIGAGVNNLGSILKGQGISQAVVDLANKAKSLGIDVPVDRIANSKPLNAIAASLNYIPLSGRSATESKLAEQLNTAVSKTIGQDTSNVSIAMRKAASDLGDKFDQTLKNNAVPVDSQFLNDLSDVLTRADKELPAESLRVVGKQVENLFEKGSNGEIDGNAAYNIKRTLDRIGDSNRPEAFHAREVKKALMEALNRGLGPEEAAVFAKTRQQYGAMTELENLVQNGAEGGVSAARLAGKTNLRNPELQDLADISAQFLRTRESNHGAMQRSAAALGIGGTAGLPYLAGTMAAGRATNAALNSQALKNMMLGVPGSMDFTSGYNALARTLPQAGAKIMEPQQ